jgi:uncharacterized protein YbjT (DUF2867 family)
MSGRVAIAGATGSIGGRLVPRRLSAHCQVRCLVRSPGKLTCRPWARSGLLAVQQANLADPSSVAQGLAACDAAYCLVHSMNSAGRGYASADLVLAKNFARAAAMASLPRIIYLEGLGETGPELSEHVSLRREVEHALASTGVPVTVFRAAIIIGSGSASFEILRYLVERLPVMITPK